MNNLTQEELEKLQTIVSQYEEASFRIGQFTIEIESAKEERKQLIEIAKQALDQRVQLINELENKYGQGSTFNISTGEVKNEQNQ